MSARCVHVVDDEEPIRRSMDLMLRVLGYEARAFESGTAFLQAQTELAAGCLLLDLRMPEVDGLEVQRRLNAHGASHSVVVMSGHGDLAMAATALEQGAVAFLEKPFARSALQQSLDLAFLQLEEPQGYAQYLRSAAARVQGLEAADRHVLELIANGHDAGGITRETGLSAMEIEVSRSRIFTKLGAQSLTEVLSVALAARRAPPP